MMAVKFQTIRLQLLDEWYLLRWGELRRPWMLMCNGIVDTAVLSVDYPSWKILPTSNSPIHSNHLDTLGF